MRVDAVFLVKVPSCATQRSQAVPVCFSWCRPIAVNGTAGVIPAQRAWLRSDGEQGRGGL